MNQKNSLIKEGFVSFLFLGKSPVAPGTFGSFGALLLSYFIIENVLDYSAYLLLLLAGIFYYGGMQIAPWCEKKYGKDPGIYVIDEVIGYLSTIGFLLLFEVEMNQTLWILSFSFFRIFDVLKIWPAKDLEKLEEGHGIILDDIAAGIQTLLALLLLIQFNVL